LLVVRGDPGDIHALSTVILTAFVHDAVATESVRS
jgi:hypothetical protein